MSKVIIITGGSRGIGKEIGKLFSKYKFKVVLISKNYDNLKKTKEEFNKNNLEIDIFSCDVSNIDEVTNTVNIIFDKYKSIDILVNSAGISKLTLLEDNDYSKWKQQIDINLSGTYYFSRECYLKMKNNNFGRIINISSVYGLIGGEGYSAYSSSKHGIIGLTKSMAIEAAKYNITVNAICPGWVETDMFNKDMEELSLAYGIDKELLIEEEKIAVPLKRFSSAEEISEMVFFLSSENAKNITGQAINISGGLAI